MEDNRGTLSVGEPHPATLLALKWIRSLSQEDMAIYSESFSSCAIEGNRLAEICSETLNRLQTGLPVSDRYILGLAWAIRDIKNG